MSNIFFSKVLKYHLPCSNAHAQYYDVRVTNVWVHRLYLKLVRVGFRDYLRTAKKNVGCDVPRSFLPATTLRRRIFRQDHNHGRDLATPF